LNWHSFRHNLQLRSPCNTKGRQRGQPCRDHWQCRFGEIGQARRARHGLSRRDPLRRRQIVKKGDLLFTIQRDQYKAQLQQAQAQVLGAEAALFHAKTELARYTKLVKQDAATQTEVDHWVYERASAEAQLLNARAQLDVAKLNLGYTEVRAPFDGIVGKHLTDRGNVVGGEGQQYALAEITQLDPIYAVANLSEQDVLKIRRIWGSIG
jgi:RND family efflux transporter MFP subunit